MPRNFKLLIFINPVFGFLKKIPKGKISTYKIVANRCGLKNARNVGWILKQNKNLKEIPCYKIVCSNASLAGGYKFGGREKQKKLLMADGIKFDKNGKIKDFKKAIFFLTKNYL